MRVVLPFKLVGQKLVKGRDFPKSVADGSKDSVVIKVGGIPDGCIAKGYFKLSWESNTTYDLTFDGDELVVDEYIVTLPTHANNKYIDYKFSFSVTIWEGDVERLTTSPVEIVVEKSNYSDATTNTPDIPESQYDALAQSVADVVDLTNSINEDVAAHGRRITALENNGGGGGSVIVDTVYNPESHNAQSGLAVAEALEGVPIKYIESPDTDGNVVCLRDLESGTYVLRGNFKPNYTGTDILDFSDSPYFANIKRGYRGDRHYTYMQIYNPSNNAMRYYEISADKYGPYTEYPYEERTIYFNDLTSRQVVEDMIAAAGNKSLLVELYEDGTSSHSSNDIYQICQHTNDGVHVVARRGDAFYTLNNSTEEFAFFERVDDFGRLKTVRINGANDWSFYGDVALASRDYVDEEILKVAQHAHNQRIVNVRDYGAVGDGVTDDTEAIQAALHFAEDNGLPLYIPAGNYLVSKTISTYTSATEEEKAKRSNLLNIFGSGMSTTFTTTDTFDGEYVFNIEVGGAQPRMLWVHDFNLELKADVSGIYFPHIGMKGLVENLWIHHHLKEHAAVRTGIYCDACTVATFKNIKVFGPFPYTDDSMCAGLTLSGDSTKIIDCDIILCKWGIYLSGGSNWTIDNCRIDENGYGVYQNSSNNIEQDDNAYKFTGSFKNLTIKGTRLEHNRKYGIFLVSYGNGYLCNNNITICNNYFTGLGPEEENGETKYRRAMYFGRCDGVAINENYFNGASEGDKKQNINIGTNTTNLSLRGNVASLHTDGTQSYAGVDDTLVNSCFVDNIEMTQYCENATVTVRGDRIQFASKSGTVDATHTNVVSLGDGVEVTNFTANFDNIRFSQEVTLIAEGATATVKNSGVIKLAGGEDFVMGQWDTITLVRVYVYPLGTKWVEKSRSVNRAT